MSKGVNKVILIGNLGQDPEIRFTDTGSAIANYTVATSETWKDKNGEKQERTEWHRVVSFGKLAEIVGEYCKKGQKIYVEGSLRTREWEKDGVKRYSTEIIADQMQMLSGREASNDAPPAKANHPRSAPKGVEDAGGFDDDLDIPFASRHWLEMV